jgi:hypothetical protein
MVCHDGLGYREERRGQVACMTNPLRTDRREKGSCSFVRLAQTLATPLSRREKEKNREAQRTFSVTLG